MLCSGEGYSWRQDTSPPTNSEIAEAFSPSDDLKLHCVINTADRELFVLARSCRNAKILAVYHWHLQAVACGHCSGKELKKFTDQVPQLFERVPMAVASREPGVLWSAGYVSDQVSRLAEERRLRLIAGI